MIQDYGSTTAESGLRLRDSPRDGATLAILPAGTDVEILGQETWMRVRVGGQTGFVLSDYVQPVPERAHADLTMTLPAAIAASEPSIRVYRHERLVGEILRASTSFFPRLDMLMDLCIAHEVRLHITSSLREPYRSVTNAIVEPSKLSNHYVGHAIDMNIIHDQRFYNSTRLKHFEALPRQVQAFLNAVHNPDEMRWGGRFSKPDVVHIDDGLNLRDRDRFVELLNRFWGGSSRLDP